MGGLTWRFLGVCAQPIIYSNNLFHKEDKEGDGRIGEKEERGEEKTNIRITEKNTKEWKQILKRLNSGKW